MLIEIRVHGGLGCVLMGLQQHRSQIGIGDPKARQEIGDLRGESTEILLADGVDPLGSSEGAFGIAEEPQFVASKHPMGCPAGDHDPAPLADGLVQHGAHRCTA